eukprot:3409340-Pyramimonas_sp.AAC.1
MRARPEFHRQLAGASFGKFAREDAFGQFCSIRPDASPRALRVHEDIEQLVPVSEEAEDLRGEVRGRVDKLFVAGVLGQ